MRGFLTEWLLLRFLTFFSLSFGKFCLVFFKGSVTRSVLICGNLLTMLVKSIKSKHNVWLNFLSTGGSSGSLPCFCTRVCELLRQAVFRQSQANFYFSISILWLNQEMSVLTEVQFNIKTVQFTMHWHSTTYHTITHSQTLIEAMTLVNDM